MDSRRYILIAGHGRSGTNWLLEILDQSPQTHCRNEPNMCPGAALAALPSGRVSSPRMEAGLEPAWDEAIARASHAFGVRDHTIPVPKGHFSPSAQRMGLVRLAKAKKPRRALGSVLPFIRQGEWPIPWWVVDPRGRDRMVAILKMNISPGWMIWALRNRPDARIIHIVRHPGGFLNSLIKRLWSRTDPEKVRRENLDLLVQVAAADPAWAGRFGDLDAMQTVELELWYWCYATETLHRAGAGNPRYQLVNYEELAGDPVKVGRDIYRHCGLDWDDAIEGKVRGVAGESQSIASAWRDRLDAGHAAAVERILGTSLMRDWWDEVDRIRPDPTGVVFGGQAVDSVSSRVEAS